MVDLSDDSESEGNLPNTKRTPRGRAKRQRMTYDEDDSADADQDDVQVVLSWALVGDQCLKTKPLCCTPY